MMEPDKAVSIATHNAEQVERARKAAEQQAAGDTLSQLDNATTGLELVGQLGGLVVDGVTAVGHCVGAACKLVGSIGD
ncbi:hypothetical protein [Falsiroseomonas tokyonensis]|uniref:Uncharacterized protein n=1 Tax=Falsiroseomonas tokyonensis TaxID=430521 RepID=A0ABV7BSN3_9PROT|nr:hypothetical protein [Falsiroseomonas tokyonensis]MBU8538656.1 hypothetical protein [Falsiroseomonas tokyonensis]